jgi:hypothetical protein
VLATSGGGTVETDAWRCIGSSGAHWLLTNPMLNPCLRLPTPPVVCTSQVSDFSLSRALELEATSMTVRYSCTCLYCTVLPACCDMAFCTAVLGLHLWLPLLGTICRAFALATCTSCSTSSSCSLA